MVPPPQEHVPSRANSLYVQIALYACGNALALVIGLIIWNLWAVLRWDGRCARLLRVEAACSTVGSLGMSRLQATAPLFASSARSDFRDSMLFALLCSIALRAPKDWLVRTLDARLSQDRCGRGGCQTLLLLKSLAHFMHCKAGL